MKFVDVIRTDCGARFDANETAAFSRELEYVHAEVIEAKYPELKFRNVVPIKMGAPPGATSHRWFEVDGFGNAAFLDNFATDDFPTTEAKGTEQLGKIRSFGAKWMLTVEELRASVLMRVHPEVEKPKNARRAMETLLDKVVFGSAAGNLGGFTGLLHNNNTTPVVATMDNWFNAAAGTNSLSPQNIVNNVRALVDEAFIETKSAFAQYDLFLPPELGVLLDTPMFFKEGANSQYLNISIGNYLLANVARLRSISVDNFRLTGAGTTGKHRAICYPRDPEVFDAFIPMDFEQFAPEFSAMSFVTHCHGKYGGLRIKHPKAMRRADFATVAI